MENKAVDDERDTFLASLANLEADVETPCVPGELEGWISDIDDALQRLRPLLERQIGVIHPRQFADIGAEDEELLRRVELMRLEDASIEVEARRLGEQIRILKTAATNIEPDEAKLRVAFDTFVEAGIAWIIRVRTQEQAIRTWFMEAFNRDRGDVD
jgi:hypothetical protein